MEKHSKGTARMISRDIQATDFLASTQWADSERVPLAGDASNRRYERIERPDGTTAVLMDAPPEKGEDIVPFVQIARHLNDTGLSAPHVLAEDVENGFLLLEDLGDDLFARVVRAQPHLEHTLYSAATDALITLQAAPPPAVASYDAHSMTQMAALAFDWYQRAALGQTDQKAASDFRSAFHKALVEQIAPPSVLILRDYHAENLLWLPDRVGVSRVGLLDFQDAMLGHPAYDLVSLLQDARRDVPLQMEELMLTRYVDKTGVNSDQFRTGYALLGLQRNLRILGVFTRLCVKTGKPDYVDLIPRVWAFIERNLKHPALIDLRELVQGTLPVPSTDVLKRIKSQCATHQAA